MAESHYIVVNGSMTHLGEQTTSIEGAVGDFTGQMFYATFTLPDDYSAAESAIIQCRSQYNNGMMKFILNNQRIENILTPHSRSRDEWISETVVIAKNLLQPGSNTIHIGHSSSVPLEGENFMVDNIILWYKTRD